MTQESNVEILDRLGRRYEAGFTTDIESDALRGITLAQMLAPPPRRPGKAIPATLATA